MAKKKSETPKFELVDYNATGRKYKLNEINDFLNKRKQEKQEEEEKRKKYIYPVGKYKQETTPAKREEDEKYSAYGEGHSGYEGIKETTGKLNVQGFNEYKLNQQDKLVGKGRYDNGTDPIMMSDDGVAKYVENNKRLAEEAKTNSEKAKRRAEDGGVTDVIEYVMSLKEKEQQNTINAANRSKEEKEKAEAALQAMYANEETDKKTYRNLAMEQLFGDWGVNLIENAPDDDARRERTYRMIMNDDYHALISKMNSSEIAQLDEMLDAVWQRKYQNESYNYDQLINAYEMNAAAGQKEQQNRETQKELRRQAETYGLNAGYDESLIQVKRFYPDEYHDDYMYEPAGSDTDKAYYWMNNLPGDNKMDNSPENMHKEYFVTQEMRETYNTLFRSDKQNGTNTAGAFLEAITPYLNQCLTEYNDYYWREAARDPFRGTALRIMSPALNTVGGIVGTVGTGLALLGNKEAQDPNSKLYMTSDAVSTIREEQNEIVDQALGGSGVAKFMMNVADSIADNLFSMGTATALTGSAGSKAGMRLVQLIMSGSATSNTMVQKLAEGYDPTEAALYAIADGVIEWFTEKVSLEALLNPDVKEMLGDKKEIAKFLAKTTAAEGSEEIASDLLNLGFDSLMSVINNHETELQKEYAKLIANGMDPKEAEKKVLADKWQQIGMSGLAGAISGGVLGSGRVAINAYQNSQIGATLNGNKEDVQAMAEKAAAMGEGTNSAKSASKLLKQLEAKGKVKNSDVGKLAQNILLESNEKIGKSAKEQTQSAIEKMLQDKGVEAEEAKNLAPMIKKALELGGIEKLSKKERDAIHANEAAVNTLYQFRFNQQLQQDVVKAAEGQEQNASAAKTAVSDLLKKNIKRGASIVKQATDKEVQLAEENGSQRINGNREAIIYDQKTGNGSFVKIDGITTKKKSGRWQLSVNITTADGQKMSVAPSDLHVTDYKASQIITAATNMPELYSDGFTKLLLDSANSDMIGDEKNLDKTLEEITTLRMVAYAGLDTSKLKLTGISEKLAEVIRQQAAHEHEQNQAKWEGKKNRRTDPRITYGNAVFGTEAWTKAIENLDEETKNWMETIAGIAQRAGIDVSFRDMKNDMLYGAEGDIGAERTGIALNIKGYDYTRDEKTKEIKRSDKKHHMLVTFGHELTHWLQRNSRDGYNRLEQFVLQTYVSENSVEDLAKRLRNRMFNEGESIEEALSEIVAESCDQILMDEEVRDHIAKTDGKLFTEIKNFVKDLVERFKKAVLGMEDSQSYYARQMANHMNELRKIWLGAYDEALSGMAQNDETNEENDNDETTKYSEYKKEYEFDSDLKDNLTKIAKYRTIGNKGDIVIGETLQILQDIKIVNKTMVIGQDHARQAFDKMGGLYYKDQNHKTSVNKMMKVLRSANDPVMIIWSEQFPDSSVVIVTDEEINNAVAIVPVHVATEGHNNTVSIDVNRVTSAYGKDGIKNMIVRAFNQELFHQDGPSPGVFYYNEKKAMILQSKGLHVPSTVKNGLIHYVTDNPNFVNQEFKHKEVDQIGNRLSKALQEDLDEANGPETAYGDHARFSKAVTDPEELRFLDNQKTIKTYKSMQLIDGKLYPPMAAVVAGNYEDASELGAWEKATEHPELIKNGNKFTLNKGKGKGSLDAAYNPYMHSSNLMINDQFSGAYNRPNLVTVECEVPSSEMDSGYHAEFAKDSVGWHNWHTGPVAGQLRKTNGTERQVFLSRWIKPVRIVPDAEVAQHYKQLLDGTDISVPDNVITPSLKKELIKAGVKVEESGRVKEETRLSKAQLDDDYMAALESGDKETQRRIVDESARRNGYIPVTRYHQTGEKFTEFNTNNPVAGATDSETPNGIFFKDNDHDIGVGGDYVKTGRGGSIQMNVYLKYSNMLHFKNRQEAVAWYEKNIDGYKEERAEWDRIYNEKYKPQFDAIDKEMFDPKTTDDRYAELEEQEEKLIQELGEEERTHHKAMREILNDYFLNGNSKYDGIELDYDGHRYIDGKRENVHTYIVFNPSQVKSADLVTYDNKGEVIKPSQRFNDQKTDIRWSRAIEEEAEEKYGIDLNMDDHTATMFSRASYERSEYYKNPDEMARMLARNVLGSESQANVRKAKKWIRDVTGVAALISERSELLDYIASPGRSSFKSNPEYGGSIDSSTICAKRLLQTGTIDAIQRAMPDYVMSAEDFLQIRRMMKERGYEVSCGLCFVESSRKNIAKYASQFMREWNSQHPENQVNMVQINTVLGLEDTRLNNKEVYEAYEKFMNKLAQRKPKLFEMRSEYDNDILKHFKNDSSVKDKNRNGGMRINSFSDFEIVHLIDMMQVIMDMSNVGLAGQAYTKVREFAEALGKTGLKINMSMIAKGVDENGRIIFDEVEGMKWSDVEDLRDRYADNVGTVCVVFTEEQLMAAMADDRIDFIIPFHRSQWNKSNYKDIGLPENTKDFTYWQNERYRTPVYGTKKDGSPKKLRAANYMPNEYWDFTKSGKQNAEAYLEKCYKENKVPKFWKWLDTDGKGRYFLKADGSTDGYWKLLIDFKMYNHITKVGAEQMPVKPEFDMDACERMLKEYKGGHQSFPEATDVVKDFVAEKRKGKKGVKVSQSGQIRLAGNEIDEQDTRMSKYSPESMDVQTWMKAATYSTFQTEDERALWEAYHRMRNSMDLSLKKQLDYRDKIRQLEEAGDKLTPAEKDDLTALRNRMEIEKNKYARQQDELIQITTGEGFASMMYRNNRILKDYIQGKTQDQVRQAVEGMLKLVQQTQEEIRKDTEELKKLSQTQAVKTMKSFMGKSSLSQMATNLRKAYNSTLGKAEIEDRMAEMVLKQASGQDITANTEALARDLMDKVRGYRTDLLDYLQGVKLNIGENMLDEYIAQNRITEEVKRNKNDNDESVMKKARRIALKQLNDSIKGSGVKIISEGENSRFSEQWSELRNNNGALADIDGLNEMDGLNKALDQISDNVKDSLGSEQNKYDFDEVAAMVRASVGNVTTYLSGDADARAQINNLMKQIRELSSKTEKTAEGMEALEKQLDDVILAGQKAKGWTTILQRDVAESIRYYNKTAKVAAQVAKNEVRKKLIETLKSQHTKELLQQQEKYEEMMRNDKKARELAQENQVLRRKIGTVATRLANRIFAETDQKNVPEEAKPLVRQVLDMMSAHDAMSEEGTFFRKVTLWDKQQVENIRQRLMKMIAVNGKFNPDSDLDFMVIKAPDPADNDYTVHDKVVQDLIDIESGLMEYRAAEGRGRITLADRKAALSKVQEAISEIWDVVMARSEAEIAGRRMQVIELAEMMREDMKRSEYKGERIGFGSNARTTLSSAVNYGNLTPEYFFKNLKNKAMDLLHKGLKIAENRSGLEAMKARERVAQIAEETGFSSWDGQEKHEIDVEDGEKITVTTEQLMALYATWKREHSQLRPEDTAHLLKGGFVLAQEKKNKGMPGRMKDETRPIRMTWNQLQKLGSYLTDQQREYVDAIVQYMSGELAEIGNEASMKMYGIKKFTEQFYFPIKAWGGVLNSRSDAGVNNNNENRAAQQGFSKRIKNNASNAIEIGDFTPTAMKHIAGMINYNTVGPAIENMNKVLNQQLQYGEIKYTPDGEIDKDNTFKMNMRAAFKRAYGQQASEYLAKFMKDMNGGVTQERTPFDKLLGLFKKNAVAGSLSVAAQQPLSYIRAAMMVNPKYLAQAILPQYWKGSYAEMMKHSGIAVIKEMGKFDMNFGRTMQEWITPEGMQTTRQKIAQKASDVITGGPQKMDAMTWTRMWTAVKLEQMAQHKGMDYNSDEFMDIVAERFNDLMRKTQVYDSVMTKSQNMRSSNKYAKTLTSFMAEPTLSLNVLEDAWRNRKEEGGVKQVAKALATFALSAAAQAGAKALFGTGRSPKKDKNREENFLSKFWYNFLSEANVMGLIPGYRQMIDILEDGEITDDALGMIGKAKEALENVYKLVTGEGKGTYRDLEDSIGQLIQLTTDIPAKNLMRDFRAMVNFFSNGAAVDFTGDTYQQRETNRNVLKYDWWDTLMTNDLIGVINKMLGDAGYGTTNKAYYQRIYDAEKAGNKQAAEEMKDYLISKSTAEDPEKSLKSALAGIAKKDKDRSAEETAQYLIDNGTSGTTANNYVTDQIKAGTIKAEDARKLLKEIYPNKTDDEIWWTVDRAEWTRDHKLEESVSGQYYRLYDAISNNKSDEIKAAVQTMTKHGMKAENIKKQLATKYKQAYLEAKGSEKTRLMDALTKAYKAVGLTGEEALKIINGWKPASNKK